MRNAEFRPDLLDPALPATRRSVLLAGIAGAIGAFLPTRNGGAATMPHIVLLGDSTLDNAAYVAAGQDVRAQLQAILPAGGRTTLLAIDGDVITGVSRQLGKLPGDASHLVVSVGGNDALGYSGLLSQPARSVAEVLEKLAEVRERFAADYRAMLGAVLARKLPTAICTIYDPAFPDVESRRIGATALTVLNDLITREAASNALSLIDLRVMFNDPADYANAIEPSAQGGRKLAAAIAAASQHSGSGHAAIFVGPT
jgi:lysophospholipase L1-like esterase